MSTRDPGRLLVTVTGFRPRRTRPVGVFTHRGWLLKGYEITASSMPVERAVAAAAHEVLDHELPEADGAPPVGFSILHQGVEAVWLLADLWRGDILFQHTFSAPLGDRPRFGAVPAGGPTACVWELAVHSHEREAFIRHILAPVGRPDVEGYLADTLTIEAEEAV